MRAKSSLQGTAFRYDISKFMIQMLNVLLVVAIVDYSASPKGPRTTKTLKKQIRCQDAKRAGNTMGMMDNIVTFSKGAKQYCYDVSRWRRFGTDRPSINYLFSQFLVPRTCAGRRRTHRTTAGLGSVSFVDALSIFFWRGTLIS